MFIHDLHAFLHKKVICQYLIAIAIIVSISTGTNAGEKNNLVGNPGAEDGKDGIPLAWEKNSASNCIWDKEVKHSGTYSISVWNKEAVPESAKHNLWHQKIPISGKECYIFSTWIKTRDVVKKDGRAGIDLWITDSNGKRLRYIGQSYGLNRIYGNSEWQLYQKKFTTPENAAFLEIYALMQQNTSGQIWFDDISLCSQNEEGSQFKQVFPYETEYDGAITAQTKEIIDTPRNITAAYGSPLIDGKPADECWKKSQKIDKFVIAGRDEFAGEQTIAAICHDRNNLYISFECRTADTSKLKATFTKEEENASLWYDDCIDIFIYSKEKKLTAHFIVNSNGAKWSGIHRELIPDTSWKPAWTAMSIKNQDSWTTEVALPLKELNSLLGATNNWTINFCRENKINGENSSICFMPYSNRFLQPGHFATISFMEENAPEKGVKDDFDDKMAELHKLQETRKKAVENGMHAEYTFKNAFDFGTDKSPLKKGFTRVTPGNIYSPEKGYGWTGNSSMAGIDRKIDPKTGSPNELTCDFIEGKKSAQFRIDVPDGEYMLYLISGDTNDPAPIFKVYSDDKFSGEIKFGGRYNFQPFEFPVKAKDQRLLLTFKGDAAWLINSLIIFPAKDIKSAKKELDKIEKEIYLGAPEYVIKYAKYEYNETNPLPEDKDKKGYIIFSRSQLDPVYSNMIPEKKEITSSLSLSACRGEYGSATFSILPLKDLKNVRISVSDLIDAQGEAITKSNIEIQEVKNHYHNINMSAPPTYILAPKIIDDFTPADMESKKTSTIWLNTKIPDGTPAGNYKGQIKVEADNAPDSIINFNVQVPAFDLDVLKKTVFCMCYHLPLNCPERGIDGWKLLEADLTDMKKHNMNSVNLFVINQNLWPEFGVKRKSINTAAFLRFLGLCKKTGLTEPVPLNIGPYFPWDPNQSNHKESIDIAEWQYVIDSVNELEKEIAARNLPKVFWYVDEPATDVKKQNVANFCKFIKQHCPTAKIFITFDTSFEYADVVVPDSFRLIKTLKNDPEYIEEENRKNVSVWTYNAAIHPFLTKCDRLATGFMMWIWKVEGQLNFTYQLYHYHKNPYNPLDNPNIAMYGQTYPGAEGPLSTLTWEAIKNGVNDLRYIKTLEAKIDLARKSNNAEAQQKAVEAEKYLYDLKDKLSSIDWDVYKKNINESEVFPDADFFDIQRGKITDLIDGLSRALNK